MKTTEQINLAKELQKQISDYIELAKVEKKMKDKTNQNNVSNAIKSIVEDLTLSVEEL